MSMRYNIRHTTRFTYPIPVSVCHNIVCLTPRPDPRITVHHATLDISPRPGAVAQRTDPFGNITHVFSIEAPHEALCVEAAIDVTIHDTQAEPADAGPPWEAVATAVAEQTDPGWYQAVPFLYDSPLVTRSHLARELAQRVFTPGRPIREAVLDLARLIHREFTYQPGATHVGTDSGSALRERHGVCQDFAHAMLAALRSVGLAARYVSGYLRTIPPPGQPRLIGVDQSHAWAGVYCGEGQGWLDIDPTNGIACAQDHIPIAVGRDYNDVAPIRGAFLGGGASQLVVTVDVEASRESPAAGP